MDDIQKQTSDRYDQLIEERYEQGCTSFQIQNKQKKVINLRKKLTDEFNNDWKNYVKKINREHALKQSTIDLDALNRLDENDKVAKQKHCEQYVKEKMSLKEVQMDVNMVKKPKIEQTEDEKYKSIADNLITNIETKIGLTYPTSIILRDGYIAFDHNIHAKRFELESKLNALEKTDEMVANDRRNLKKMKDELRIRNSTLNLREKNKEDSIRQLEAMIRERDLGLEYLEQLIRSFSGGLNGILPFSLEFRGINVDDEMVDIIPDPDHSSDSENFSNCFEKFSLEWVKRKKLSDDFVYLYAEYVKTLNDHELDVKNIDIEQKIIDTNREIKIIKTDYEKIKAELTRKDKEKDIFKRNADQFENELKKIMSEKLRELNDLEIKIKRETVNGPKQIWKMKMLELQRSYQNRIQDFQSDQFGLKTDITTDLCHMLINDLYI